MESISLKIQKIPLFLIFLEIITWSLLLSQFWDAEKGNKKSPCVAQSSIIECTISDLMARTC